jgi:hypothetical protein
MADVLDEVHPRMVRDPVEKKMPAIVIPGAPLTAQSYELQMLVANGRT